MKKTFLPALYLLIFSLIFVLSSCASVPEEDPNLQVTEYVTVAGSADDLAVLEQFPNLQTLDLRGSSCYDAILTYMESHPNVTVTYDITLGGKHWSPETTDLELEDGSFTADELMKTLKYFPSLKTLSLPCTTLDAQTLYHLAEVYPKVSLDYSVVVANNETASDTTEIDLSEMDPQQLDAVLEQLQLFPALTHLQLMKEDGTSPLSPVDVRQIMDTFPGVTLNYSFELFGKTISITDERVEYINEYIGNEGIEQIRQALDILTNCTYFLMDTCGVDNEVMAQLRDDYPNTKIVWRVWLVDEDYTSKLYLRCGSYLTDTHRVRTTYVNDENSHVLNYCTETKYVDVGHVWQLTQCEFLAYMPELEVCIIAITEITDITPLANHEKLEYLELFTTDISDLTPLISCPNIEHLNLSNMPLLSDISPIYGLTKLKRLRMVDSPLISAEQKKEAAERLPDCNILNMGNFATAWGWRYLDPEKQHKDERYALLCEQMEYEIDAYQYGIP